MPCVAPFRRTKGEILASPRLYGPFQLTEGGVNAHLQADSPGVFVLGYLRNNLFIVSYVGRDDVDLKTGLRAHLLGPYQQFKFTYALSARDAYLKECELYHDYVGLDNSRHPAPSKQLDLQCPRCQISARSGRV
jgi:hypothetical protein